MTDALIAAAPVVIFTREDCGFCKQLKALLAEIGVEVSANFPFRAVKASAALAPPASAAGASIAIGRAP